MNINTNSVCDYLKRFDFQGLFIEEPHLNILTIVGLEDRDISRNMNFPAARRQLLDLHSGRA